MLTILALGLGGCVEPAGDWQGGGGGSDRATAGTAAGEPRSSNAPVVMSVHFQVQRIDLPLDAMRHSLKVWNHVDESLADPALAALLARNGMRMGVADRDAWPALEAIFEQNDARSTRVAQTALNGHPMIIPAGEVAEGDTYFLHRRGGKLTGGTFNLGQQQWQVEYALDEDDPSQVILRITPRVEEAAAHTKYVAREGEVVQVRDHEGVTFHDLTATFVIRPGQFVVIGASKEADRGYLPGSLWLTSQLAMQRFETVLCIEPQLVRLQ